MDPLTFTRVWSRVQGAADESDATTRRAAFSSALAEEGELASIVAGPDGTCWTHGSTSNPFQAALLEVWVSRWSGWKDTATEGTVFVSNDPYVGGSSLCDLRMLTPVFHGGERVAVVASAGHYSDLGGSVSGGVSPHSQDVRQEGLPVGPATAARGWLLDDDLAGLISANTRFPHVTLGDLRAQVEGLRAGSARLAEIVDRYGPEALAASAEHSGSATEEGLRSALSGIEPGADRRIDWFDSDSLAEGPLRLEVHVSGGEQGLEFDFDGTHEAVDGGMNCPSDAVHAACITALRSLFPEFSRHGAAGRLIQTAVPVGSLLDARSPSPVGGATQEVVPRVMSLAVEALSRRVSGRGAGAGGGGANLVILEGVRENGPYLMRLSLGAGAGASGCGDGLSNGDSGTRFTRFPSLEAIETQFPIRILKYGLRPGSGGAGRYVGGMGTEFAFELLKGPARLTLFLDRGRRGAGGLLKGSRGARTQVRILRHGAEEDWTERLKVEALPLEAGDRLTVRTAGGGAYGHPCERAIRLVGEDVRAGLLTMREAAVRHGVVFNSASELDYDPVKTFKLRSYRLTMSDVEDILDELEGFQKEDDEPF